MSRLRLSLMLGAAILPVPALAQVETPQPESTSSAPGATNTPAGPTAASQSADTNNGLGDIIVTATKRETNLQQTPISISVLNTQALEDRHALSLIALGDGSIPSLRIATFEARQSALTVGIRGIVPYDANQTARDNGVTVYLDGIALGKTQGLNTTLLDIERIEVLKGPQGTLFGRNTEGGAVSLISRGPSGEFEGRVSAGIGNYSSRNGEAHIDLPEFMNVALKFDGVYQHQGPTTKDPLAGSTGWNYYDRKGGRVQARWQPFEGFTANISYDQTRDDNTPFYSQLVNYNPNNYPVGVYVNTAAAGAPPAYSLFTSPTGVLCGGNIPAGNTRPVCVPPLAPLVGIHPNRQKVADVAVPQQPSTDLTHGVSAHLNYKLADGLELRSITAWRAVSTDQWDNSGGPERSSFAPNTNFSRYSLSFLRQHQFSQEVQAVGSLPNLDYVVGAYYYTEYASEYAATPLTNQWNADGTAYTIRSPIFVGTVSSGNNSGYQQYSSLCNNLLATTVPQFANSCQFITRASTAHDHNYSVFGQATFTPPGMDILHITAGGRWTKDRRRGQLYVVNNGYIGSTFTPFTPFTFKNSISRFDPLVTVALDATPDVHLYAKYATGFRAGGANDRSQRFDPFGPEAVKSYEVGLKADFFDHMARLNLAGYIMDRSNTQFDFDLFDTAAGSPTNGSHIEETQNAGQSKIRGIEADLTIKPTRELTLGASYAYTYWRAPSAVNPITGGPVQQLYIVYTPKHAASGFIDYAMPVGSGDTTLRLHLDANYSGRYNSFELEPTLTDSSFIVNGRLSLADIAVGRDGGQRVTFAIWARNLFNESHIYRRSNANSSPVLNYCGSNGLNGTTPCVANALISTNYGGILGDYANFNTPRTFGGEMSIKF